MKYQIKCGDDIIKGIEIEGEFEDLVWKVCDLEYVKSIDIPEEFYFEMFKLVEVRV
jgi:hypothetical protein